MNAAECRDRLRFGLAVTIGIQALALAFAASPAVAQNAGPAAFLTHGEREWLAEHPVIRLAPDPNFPPIEFFDADGALRGIAADYIALIEAKLGLRFEIVRTRNWAENVDRTKSRGNDVWSAVARTSSWIGYMRFTKPYLESPAVIVVRNDVREELKTADLMGKTVAVVAEYGIHEHLADDYPEIILDTVPDVLTGLRMVSFGIVDAMAVNMALASHVIEKSAIANLRVAGSTGFTYHWAFASRNDWPELSHILEKALAQISAEERSAISRKWIAFEQPSWRPSAFQIASALVILALLVVVGVLFWVRALNRLVRLRTEEANTARDLSVTAEAQLRAAIENMSEGFVHYDPDYRLVIANTRFHEFWGYTEEEAAPGTSAKALHDMDLRRGTLSRPEDFDYENQRNRRLSDAGYLVQLGDGRWLEIIERRMADGGLVGVQSDVTERKRAEEALKESEGRLREILEHSPIAISVARDRGAGDQVYSNQSYCDMLSDGGELTQADIRDSYVNPEDRKQMLGLLAEEGVLRGLEVERRRANGEKFWALMSSQQVEYEGAPTDILWIFDITTRKQAEAELAKRTNLLQAVLGAMTPGIVAFDKDLKLASWNDQYMKIREYPEKLAQAGTDFADFMKYDIARNEFGPGDPELGIQEQVVRAKRFEPHEFERQRPDGTFVEVSGGPIPGGGFVSTYTDITERKQAEAELAEKEAQLRSALDNMSGGIYMVDKDLNLQIFNDNFQAWYEIPDGVIRKGAPIADVVAIRAERGDYGPGDPEQLVASRLAGFFKAETHLVEDRLPSGRIIEDKRATTDDGGIVSVFTDVTERINAAQELERARDQAEAATRSKSAFLASMSHEIRTPMNGVVGMLELLTGTKLDADQREMSDTIRKSAFALLQIIDDILDFSKIEAGQLNLERISVSVSDVVETVADILGPGAREKDLAMVAFVDPTIPEPILGDPVRLRQILFNLVGNAVKFTESGQVTIRAERLPGNRKRPEALQLKVIDTGIGIPGDAVDDLFEAFTQAESSTTRRFGGTGLGLSICTLLTELMEGSIAVDSEPGVGSTFTVTLPLERTPAEAAGTDAEKQNLAGLRVLVAAANDDVRGILKHYLRHWRAAVRTTSSIGRVVSLALKAAGEERKFDVIVLGAVWSDEKKAEICDAVRAEAKLAGTRFVLTTFERRRGATTTHDDCVEVSVHPMRRASFLTAVAIAAGRESPEVRHVEEFSQLEDLPVPTIEEARSRGALILVAEDNPTNQFVILRQLNRLGLAAEIAVNGREAFDMWRGGSYALVLTDCHMPDMDGFELTAAIRQAEVSTADNIPIVAVTANALRGEAERCLAAGMDDFLAKPVELLQLRKVLAHWLPPAAIPMPPGGPPAPASQSQVHQIRPEALPDSHGAVDVAGLARLLGSDDSTYLGEMLAFFWETIADTPIQLEVLIRARDAAGLKEVAHAAKGAARSAAAEALAAALQDLEVAADAADWSAVEAMAPRIEREFSAVEEYICEIAAMQS